MKRVVCAVDLSDTSIELLRYANAIVQRYGGCLTVLHVVPTFGAMETNAGAWFDPAAVAGPKAIEQLRETVTAAGLRSDRVRYEAEAGEPAMTIVHRALALHADTIVLGTCVSGGLGRLLLGSVTDTVLRRAPCDVLTVPPVVSFAAIDSRPLTIVCGVDFSTPSIYAVRATLGIADRMDARIVLVHAVEWLAEVEPPDQVDFDVSDFRTRLVCNGQRRLDALVADESPLDRGIVTKVVIGRSHRELLTVAAEARADLIVLGSDGRGGTLLPLLGSTVERIVRAAPSPVLTIRLPHTRLAHANHS